MLTKNTELDTFNVFVGKQPNTQACMRYCIESSDLFCRSFFYAESSHNCYVGVDSFYQSSISISSVSATTSDNFHLYEPVCLDESVELPCPNMHIFERIIEMNLVDKLENGKPLLGQGFNFLIL